VEALLAGYSAATNAESSALVRWKVANGPVLDRVLRSSRVAQFGVPWAQKGPLRTTWRQCTPPKWAATVGWIAVARPVTGDEIKVAQQKMVVLRFAEPCNEALGLDSDQGYQP